MGEVTLLAIGPMENHSRAYHFDPESKGPLLMHMLCVWPLAASQKVCVNRLHPRKAAYS